MPIIRVKAQPGQQFAGAETAIRQHEAAPVVEPERTKVTPGWFEAVGASWGTTWMAGALDSVQRPFVRGQVRDDAFNPYDFIEKSRMKDDPQVQYLVEHGQFDRSFNEALFWNDYENGMRFLTDSEIVSRRTWGQAAASFAIDTASDPTNLVPLGMALKGARGTVGLAKQAGVFGAFGLANKLATNTFQPASNDPGVLDEAVATATAAGFGGALGLLGGAISGLRTRVPTAKLNRLRERFDEIVKQPIQTARKAASSTSSEAGSLQVSHSGTPDVNLIAPGEKVIPPTKPGDISLDTLDNELAWGTDYLKAELAKTPVDNNPVTVLFRDGDANDKLLKALKKKYKAAGKTLQVIQHPSQSFYDDVSIYREIMSSPDLNAEALPGDLDQNWLDNAWNHVASRYSNLQGKVTPAGRVVRSAWSRIDDAYRTVFGSAQTVTKGSATNPEGFVAGVPAESIKSLYEGIKDASIIGLRRAYQAANRTGQMVYDGTAVKSYEDWRAAIHNYTARENAKAAGFTVPDPVDVHPSIVEASKQYRKYFAEMFDHAELAGTFQHGPRELAKHQEELKVLKAKLAKAEKRAAKEKTDAAVSGDATRWEKAEKSAANWQKKIADNQAKITEAEKYIKKAKTYLPHLWDREAILANRTAFIDKLAYEMDRGDGILEGVQIARDQRELLPDVAAKLDQKQLLDAAAALSEGELAEGATTAQMIAGLTEGDLPDTLRTAYRAEIQSYYRKTAEEIATNSLNNSGFSGTGIGEDFARARILNIDENAMRDFLVQDPEAIIDRYHDVMGGRIAMRRAISLAPSMKGAKLRDGTAVKTGEDLKKYLVEMADVMERIGRHADKLEQSKAGQAAAPRFDGEAPAAPSALDKAKALVRSKTPHADAASKFRSIVTRDLGIPIDMIEGRNFVGNDSWIYDSAAFMGRTMLKLSGMNKLGGVAINQLNDTGPTVLYSMQTRHSLNTIRAAITGLKGLATRDLELLGLALDGATRSRALTDTDTSHMRLGFGTGKTRRVTAGFERRADQASDFFFKATGFNWLTNTNKKVSGMLVLDRVTWQAKQMLQDISKLDAYDAARLNKLGLTKDGARKWLRNVYDHGTLIKSEKKVSDEFKTFDDFLKSGKDGGVLPNFDEWSRKAKADADFVDSVMSNIRAEVERHMVVTPGVGDRPLWNRTVVGRMFNQFQTFGMAFNNQRLRVMAQMPLKYQAPYMMTYLALGATTDAIQNQLSGRRSLDETASLWASNPFGMIYAAWEKSGMSGWAGRPLSVADSLRIPFSPGTMLKAPLSSTASRKVEAGRPLTLFGPAAADLDTMIRVTADTLGGRADQKTAYDAAKLLPFQNYLFLRLLHQATGAPVVPEAIRPDPAVEREPSP